MRNISLVPKIVILLLCAVSARAQGNTFTYQGLLTESGGAYSGSAEFLPTLWDAPEGGAQLAANSPSSLIVNVTNGLFTLPLDFGANFPGADRWLQLEVRTSIGSFTTLSPRQPLTATPYAITAGNLTGPLLAAQLSGTVPSANLAGTYSGALTLNNAANTFSGSGAGLTELDASQLTSGTVPDARLGANVARTDQVWLLGGSAGTTPGTHFLGTTDDQPLELKVNGTRALRLEPNTSGAPNVIGGSPNNSAAAGVVGATIGGGGALNHAGVAYINRVEAHFGTIGGGRRNTIQTNALDATIGGGVGNTIQTNAYYATIGGGANNTIQTNAYSATIGGGVGNTIQTNAYYATIGGGANNTIQTNAHSATIGGGVGNIIQTNAYYTTIGGGANNTIQTNAYSATIGGGHQNTIQTNAFWATIGGGWLNTIQTNAQYATIGGGANNTIHPNTIYATIGGGVGNTIQTNAYYTTIGGGDRNTIQPNALYAVIGGGANNTNHPNANYATIPGGTLNSATNYAFAAGRRAKANHTGAFVWADSLNADFASTANNQFNVRASGGARFETSGGGLTVDGIPVLAGVIPSASLTGTYFNALNFSSAANIFNGNGAGLTELDASQLTSGTVPDARLGANVARADQVWLMNGNAGTTIGTHFMGTTDNRALEFKVNNQRGLRLQPTSNTDTVNVIGGSARNFVSSGVSGATIGGGGSGSFGGSAYTNSVASSFGTVSGGAQNAIQPQSSYSAIGGGLGNTARSYYATIGGGWGNTIQTDASSATIGGGRDNTIQTGAFSATIGGGFQNTIQTNTFYAVIGGGANNTNHPNARYATIPGGTLNSATNYAFAAGRRAKANHTGSFLWADSQDEDFLSDRANQFKIRAAGGVSVISRASGLSPAAMRIESTTANGVGIAVTQTSSDATSVFSNRGTGDIIRGFSGPSGNTMAFRVYNNGNVAITGTLSQGSDRNNKENFTAVDGRQILEKVAALPISIWNYKTEETRHIGPTAQDFRAAFGLGENETTIATVDTDGVALAAIQGLNQKLTQELQRRDVENAELKQSLNELKKLVVKLTQKVEGTAR